MTWVLGHPVYTRVCVCIHTQARTHTIQIDNVCKSLMCISYYTSGTTDFLKLVDELFAGFFANAPKMLNVVVPGRRLKSGLKQTITQNA